MSNKSVALNTQNFNHSTERRGARCIWLTGLSGAGKSSVAQAVAEQLRSGGKQVFVLDGDTLRRGLNRDLGFTEKDRAENVRRVAEVSRLMSDAGLLVIVAVISPYMRDRAFARSLFQSGQFMEVFVDAPLTICESRDVKGLYAKARAGVIPHFTGIDSAYESPISPELHLQTDLRPLEQCVSDVMAMIEK
jgi:bifunctional enzyme CysN/CysC